MYSYKNSLSTQFKKVLARILVLVLMAGVTAVPAQAAAARTAGVESGALIDESRLTPACADTAGAKWKKVGNYIRLKGSDGKYMTGFVKYRGKYYYFNSKGNLKVGFFTVGGKTWFASYVKGDMGKGQILTGIIGIKGHRYYMDPASSPCPGAVAVGFRKIQGKTYYFNQNGHMVTGWFTVGGNKYYASCNKKKGLGSLLTGIQKIGNKTYQFDSDGKLLGTVTDTSQASARTLTNFAVIDQHPELPTGCEVTALTMVLNYYGFPVSKLDLSDNYLPKGPVGSTDFRKKFVGDPRSYNSYGCYAPVITETANSYLEAQNSKMQAVDISGRELQTLSVFTNANIPVLVWGTIKCLKPYKSVTWYIDGEKLTWIGQEHCMVLLGFSNSTAMVADPYTGSIRQYNLALFRSRYNSLLKQAVILK